MFAKDANWALVFLVPIVVETGWLVTRRVVGANFFVSFALTQDSSSLILCFVNDLSILKIEQLLPETGDYLRKGRKNKPTRKKGHD